MQNATSQETKNVAAPYFFYTVATTITSCVDGMCNEPERKRISKPKL